MDDPELLASVAAALRLALENVWLRSRARDVSTRIVEAADSERKRLERDLHDGAQARLVFALMALRRVERGLADHPGPALTALAREAALPVVVAAEPRRYDAVVESTAYFTVCEALSNAAKHAGARAVSVSATHQDGRLVIETVDDGVGGADSMRGSGLRGLADRLAAVDGVLHVHSPAGGGTRIRAELPCG
jgi:signal transduction histidine kinase